MLNKITLTEAVRAIGRAFVYAGDPTTAGGMVALGATEGEIEVEEPESYNDLTLPEYTGEAVHERQVQHGSPLVTVPLILGPTPDGSDDGAAVYDKISSVGDGSGGGYSTQQPAVTTALLIVPESEVGDGLSFTVDVWTPAAPVHAIWIWRASAEASNQPFRFADGGKVIRSVPFRGLVDRTKPEGHMLWTRGDPDAHGITIEI